MDDKEEMMASLGIKDISELFSDVPKKFRKNSLEIPEGKSEYEVIQDAIAYASMNRTGMAMFLGNGIYRRIVPAAVDEIISRAEFLTSYTPYQAEMSQGVLQALFEYQSLISDLTSMDVTNSSMYDGFSALGEAVRMAYRINGRSEILLPESIYKSKKAVMESYIVGLGVKIRYYSINPDDGTIDLESISSAVGQDTSCVVVEQPNSMGVIDRNVTAVKETIKDAILIAYYDPVSLGIIKPPGEYGADIAVAEGQQLGIHMSYGGPLLGLFSFRKEYIRKSPGRLIGETTDVNGKRGYVMTLQTREQHIRRQRAMSNICTNQALLAIASAAYLSVLGRTGLRNVALKTIENSRKLTSILRKSKFFAGFPFG
ncbi:aminomethyl-transferring glycine dehydrogenase subunit GcvPA, partial [Thermoplasmatales archaeon AK]|nr:aminomethyl-transferring glycine dehydrogenase subunit GcvPA [Thermoplasmatales archaeon AK]